MEEFKRCIDSNLNTNWIHKLNHSNTTMMNFFSNQYACIPAAISSLFKPQKLFFSVTCQQLYFWVTTNAIPVHVFILKTPQVRYIYTVVQEAPHPSLWGVELSARWAVKEYNMKKNHETTWRKRQFTEHKGAISQWWRWLRNSHKLLLHCLSARCRKNKERPIGLRRETRKLPLQNILFHVCRFCRFISRKHQAQLRHHYCIWSHVIWSIWFSKTTVWTSSDYLTGP